MNDVENPRSPVVVHFYVEQGEESLSQNDREVTYGQHRSDGSVCPACSLSESCGVKGLNAFNLPFSKSMSLYVRFQQGSHLECQSPLW